MGAPQSVISWMVVTYGLTLLGVGVLIGLAAAGAVTPLMGALLFGVSPFDVTTYAGVSVVLMVAGIGGRLFYSAVAPPASIRWWR